MYTSPRLLAHLSQVYLLVQLRTFNLRKVEEFLPKLVIPLH